jgi:hypothetical protein
MNAGKALSALPILLLASLAAASSTVTVQGAGSSRALTPAFNGINIDNTSGKTMLWTDTNTWSWINQLGVGSIRAPSGASSNYWDWKHGRRYGWPALNDPFSALLQLDQETNSPDVMYVLNVMTYAVNGSSVLATPGDPVIVSTMIPDQISALTSATAMGIPIPRVELGNEFYLDPATMPDYCKRFPPSQSSGGTCSNNAIGDDSGATYAKEMNPWISAIKGLNPPPKIGIVGVNKGGAYRQSNWNADMLPVLQAGAPDTGAHADAVIFHDYVDMSSPSQTPDSALSMAFSDWAWLDRQIQQVKSYGIKEAWITEWNIHNTAAGQPFQDTWMHALFTAQMLVQYSTEPMITVVQSWPLGDEQFNSTVFFPGQVQIGPAASSTTYTIPQPGMLSARGQAMAFFANAVKGAASVAPLQLSGIPVVSPAPSGQTTYVSYPAVTGLMLGSQGLFLNNLSSMTLTVDISLFSRSATMASISAPSLGMYITPSQGVTTANTSVANGLVTLTPYSISNVTFTAAPTIVSLASPANGTTISGTVSIAGLSAGTGWDNVTVSSVAVSVDGGAYAVAAGTGSWTFSLNTLTLTNGPHTLQAAAWDSSGSRAISPLVNVTVNNPPVVAISSPTNGAVLSGVVTVISAASSTTGVAKVDLYVDGGPVATDSAAPYRFRFDTTAQADGPHTLAAWAYDASGSSAVARVQVVVDNTPPTAAIITPSAGATISGQTVFEASAYDNYKVDHVVFQLDGVFKSIKTVPPYLYVLDTSALNDGTHAVSAWVYDKAGSSATAQVNVTVNNKSVAAPFNGNLDYLVCDIKRPLAGLQGVPISTANYQAIISGLKSNLGCNALRVGIDLTLTSAAQYPAIYSNVLAYARQLGLEIYANPLGTGEYSLTKDDFAARISTYAAVFAPHFLGPFNESGWSDDEAVYIANAVRQAFTYDAVLVGPDAQHVGNTAAMLSSSSAVAQSFDIVGSHNAVNDTGATAAAWTSLSQQAGKSTWASENPRPWSFLTSNNDEVGVKAVLGSPIKGLVLYLAYPNYVDANGNLTAQGSQIASNVLSTATVAVSPPVITSTLAVSGTAGASLVYIITASNTPTGFSAAGLPAGLSLDASDGVISGTPTSTGTTKVVIGAANAGGTGTATLVMTIGAPGYDVIILAGQSNARGIGEGPYTNVDTSQDYRIFQIGRYESQNLQIIPASDVLQNWDYTPQFADIGFAMTFAREYAKSSLASGRNILIIPAAHGGSSIIDWNPDNVAGAPFCGQQNLSIALYSDMKSRIAAALAAPGANRIVAFLWQQGEEDISLAMSQGACDGFSMSGPADYSNRLRSFFGRVRSDYSSQGSFPVLLGAPVPDWMAGNTRGWGIKQSFVNVIQGMTSYAANFGFVPSTGLTSNYDDNVDTGTDMKEHYSANSQVALGQRYAAAFEQNVSTQGFSSGALNASPGNCLLTPGQTSCSSTISWTTTNLVNKAEVWRSLDGAAPTFFSCGNSGSPTASGIQPGHSYVFTLYPASDCTSSAVLGTSLASVAVTALTAPASVAATSASTTTLTLEWSAAGNPPGTLYVAQISSNGSFSSLANSETTISPSATFSGLSSNTTYYARVAVQGAGGSTAYATAAATWTWAAVPSSGSPTSISNSVTENWGSNGNSLGTLYNVQLSADPAFGTFVSSRTANLQATFAALSGGTTYYSRVQAVGWNGLASAFANLPRRATPPSVKVRLVASPSGHGPAAFGRQGSPLSAIFSISVDTAAAPNFPSAPTLTLSATLPSGSSLTVSVAQMAGSPNVFFAVLPYGNFAPADFTSLDGTTLTVGAGTQTFVAEGQAGVVEPGLGGVVQDSSGTAQLLVLPNGVAQETQLAMTPATLSLGQTTALTQAGFALAAAPITISVLNSGSMGAATLTLLVNTLSIAQSVSPAAPQIAVYNSTSGVWSLLAGASVSGDAVTASVSQSGLYAPVVVQAVSTPGLQDVYVYPNPAVAPLDPVVRAEVGVVNSVEVTIFDAAGKVVNSGSVSGAPTGTFNGVFYYDYPWTGAKASGVYFAVVHAKAPDGTIIRAKAKFAVVR